VPDEDSNADMSETSSKIWTSSKFWSMEDCNSDACPAGKQVPVCTRNMSTQTELQVSSENSHSSENGGRILRQRRPRCLWHCVHRCLGLTAF
jgi:hypothetical protein